MVLLQARTQDFTKGGGLEDFSPPPLLSWRSGGSAHYKIAFKKGIFSVRVPGGWPVLPPLRSSGGGIPPPSSTPLS